MRQRPLPSIKFNRLLAELADAADSNPAVRKDVSVRVTRGRPSFMKKQITLKELEKLVDALRRRAAEACTCDGGNTTGCSACVAERQLKRI